MQKMTAIALSTLILSTPLAAQDSDAERVAIMVFDASGSMWNRLEGDKTRIEVARDVMESYFQSRDTSIPLAVIAYGHRQRGDCTDIETITPLARHDGPNLAARLQSLNPQGMTPLTASMESARDMIPATAESADLILITDGLENCDGDPCALAADLAAQGIDIRAHVVGFGMTQDDINTLSCLPELTGGMLFRTNSGVELAEAMDAVSTPDPQPAEIDTPPAEEVAEPDLPQATISGPDTIRAGESFSVQWSDPINSRDIATIVPMGANEGELGTWSRVGNTRTIDLRAPADPGMYELRYILDEGRRTLASAAIEVTAPDATISGPDTIRVGESFAVQWSDPINSRDIATIVPMGAGEGELGTWSRVGNARTTDLRAPADPGMYELRYILDEGRRTLASAAIEVISVEIEVTGPDIVRAGDALRITWSDRVNTRDIVTIVPLGAEEGALGEWRRVGQSDMHRDLEAPEVTGVYEARYILDEGRVTLGRHSFEIVVATATLGDNVVLEVPETAAPDTTITVTWSGDETGINQRISLARADQALFTWIAAQPVEERNEITFTLPSDPGLYEIRYLDFDRQEALSRATIDVK